MEQNPANKPSRRIEAGKRIPMSLPHLKLQVPDLPGYHLHWMRGDAQRINQALAGGYEFVEKDEVALNTFGVADDPEDAEGSDLGSRISVFGGNDGSRLYLMKIKLEYWNEDRKAESDRQEKVAELLRGDKGIAAPGGDNSQRYSRNNRNIFQPNRRA